VETTGEIWGHLVGSITLRKREAEAQEVGLDRQLLREALFTGGPDQASAKIP